jgi:hypothetical protein
MTNSIFESLLKLPRKSFGNGAKAYKHNNSTKSLIPYNLNIHDIFTIVVLLITIIVLLFI